MDIFDDDIFDDDLYKLVIAIVQRGYSEDVVFAAKSAGAKGAVVIQGKGSGNSERKFFGFRIEPENEVVMILVKEEIVVPIMKAIYSATDYRSGARGLVFALPVSYVTGMTHIKVDEDELLENEKDDKTEDSEPSEDKEKSTQTDKK